MILANLISQAHKTECTLNVFCGIHCQYKRCDFFFDCKFQANLSSIHLIGTTSVRKPKSSSDN